MTVEIRFPTREDVPALQDHFARHRAESGRGDPHFMPFHPDDPDGPRGLVVEGLDRPLTEPGWHRWFVAVDRDGGSVVGHANLKGPGLRTAIHRCELGIGIERAHRGQGLGRRLATVALDYARRAPSITWIDLRVFEHNTAARALYH